MLPTSSRLLPSRTGSAPLRKYVVPPFPQHHASQVSQDKNSPLVSSAIVQISSSTPNLSLPTFYPKTNKTGLSSAPPFSSNLSSSQLSPNRSARFSLPGTFLSPGEQHRLGMKWVQSNQNTKFNPPMPKSFPLVASIYKRKGEKNDTACNTTN